MVYADDDNLLGSNINNVKQKRQAILDTTKEISLEIHAKETKHMTMSHQQSS
jgi:hypothetical protein